MGALLLSGCHVDTRISVAEKPGGGGSLAVTVAFDAGALQALGGQSNLAKQLQYSDLEASGWTISGPDASPGGGASVTAKHGFSDAKQLSALIAEVAGSGTGPKPFRLTVTQGGGFWTDKTTVRGAVDLRCGLQCFGDPGLQSSLGGALGVAPQPLEQAAGQSPAQVFQFSLAVRLVGHAGSLTGAPAVSRDGTLTWSAPLGRSTLVGAVTESIDWPHVILASVLVALVVSGIGFGGWRLRKRHRRQGSAPGDVDLSTAPAGEAGPADGAPGEPAAGDPLSWPKV